MTNSFDLIIQVVVLVSALSLIFEGVRRLVTLGAHRKAILYSLLGAVIIAIFGAVFLVSHITTRDLLATSSSVRSPCELPDGWGSEMPSDDREKSSLAYAT